MIYIDVLFFSEANEDEDESYQEYVQNCIEPFDLTVAPLFRVYLRRLAEEEHLLLIDMHHSITDGRSSEIMINDFCVCMKEYNCKTRSLSTKSMHIGITVC